jgi:lysophospholipid acyltransferase (LPLAT)-like uncharacterized protein
MTADTTPESNSIANRASGVISWLLVAGLALLVFTVFYILHCTYRYRYYSYEFRLKAAHYHPRRSFILALWHEHLMASLGAHSFQGLSPIISLSKDGTIVNFVARLMGMRPVRGSSSRGGQQAAKDLKDLMDQGLIGAITLDGPRGPRRQSKPGALKLSQQAGVMILPSVAISDRYWTLRSWDQFKIPKPFARVAVIYGEPYVISPETNLRSELRKLTEELAAKINQLDIEGGKFFSDSSRLWTPRSIVLANATSMGSRVE